MKIQKLDMSIDEATVTLSGDITEREYKALAVADYEKADITIMLSEVLQKLVDKAEIEIAFSDDELFLLEMACDEVCYKLSHDSFMYNKFDILSRKVREMRSREDL